MKLEIKNLSKSYNKKTKALDSISLTLTEGTFGLLGPNGAGKSSLMRTIATLQSPSEGSIVFQERDIFEDVVGFKSKLGYLPQEFGIYEDLTGYDTLDYFAQLSGYYNKKERHNLVSSLLQQVNLLNDAKKKVKKYSGGMKQRIGIAIALLSDPDILVVDEPTAGLDPQERIRFLDILSSLDKPRITILSTHIVSDVSDMCDRIGILKNGKLKLNSTPQQALAILKDKIYRTKINTSLPEGSILLMQKIIDTNRVQEFYCCDSLEGDYQKIEPTLEHVYFYFINQD
ncbi:MAG: ABC transporter ATP-binding protein [Patescibacteria group bacterium]